MNEVEFAHLIDCSFPYSERERAIELVDVSRTVSMNATFMVLEEICRPPQNLVVATKTLLELVNVWRERVDHPLANSIVPVARDLVQGKFLTDQDAGELLERVAEFADQYSALNIVYFSCDPASELLEHRFDEIRNRWDHTT